MSKKIEDCILVSNHFLNDDTFVMTLKAGSMPAQVLPGQFAEVRVPATDDVFLRRPFAIHDVDYDRNLIKLYIKIVGKGSKKLSTLIPGTIVNMIYPLGNHFTIVESGRVLLVGGGTGVAPMLLLAKYLKKYGATPVVLIGGRSKQDILLSDEYAPYAELFVTTEDGSYGEKGLVTSHSLFGKSFDFSHIYTCGPAPMMRAIAQVAVQKGVPCEVSLENTMACGFGACLCCVTSTVDGNVCVCTEGPVFDAKKLKNW